MDLLAIAAEVPGLCKNILARNDSASRDRLTLLLGEFSLLLRPTHALRGLGPPLDVRAVTVGAVGSAWASDGCDKAKQHKAAERIGDFFERLRMHLEHPEQKGKTYATGR